MDKETARVNGHDLYFVTNFVDEDFSETTKLRIAQRSNEWGAIEISLNSFADLLALQKVINLHIERMYDCCSYLKLE